MSRCSRSRVKVMIIHNFHSDGESTFILIYFKIYFYSISMGIELTLIIYTVVRIPKDVRTCSSYYEPSTRPSRSSVATF